MKVLANPRRQAGCWTEPEAYALRKVYWQFFGTLTFRSEMPFESSRRKLLVSWLREFEKHIPELDYRSIMLVSRLEFGGRLGRGHVHLCMAGLPRQIETEAIARGAEKWWRRLCGGLAQIQVYDPALDGLGYVLKQPVVHQHQYASWDRPHLHVRWDELMPTLSDALLKAMKRSRYVRDGASCT